MEEILEQLLLEVLVAVVGAAVVQFLRRLASSGGAVDEP